MAKDIDRVCEKYELKLRAGRMPTRVDGDREAQLKSYRRAVERGEEVRKAVAEVLCGAGIYSIWWPYYFAFARSLTKLVYRPTPAEILRLEARTQLEVWVERGLERHVLAEIGVEVFNLSLIGPIEPLVKSSKPT